MAQDALFMPMSCYDSTIMALKRTRGAGASQGLARELRARVWARIWGRGGLFSDLRIFRVFGFLDVGILRFGSSRSIGLRDLWVVAFNHLGSIRGLPGFERLGLNTRVRPNQHNDTSLLTIAYKNPRLLIVHVAVYSHVIFGL